MHISGVLLLLCVIPVVPSQQWKQETPRWYPKERQEAKACTNLTQILDNWKFAILTQAKELLINDHASVLPEYSRHRELFDFTSLTTVGQGKPVLLCDELIAKTAPKENWNSIKAAMSNAFMIGPLSDALRELHGRFDALKDHLAGLTAKFDSVEAFVDRVKEGGFTPSGRPGAGLRSARMRALKPIRVRQRGPHKP